MFQLPPDISVFHPAVPPDTRPGLFSRHDKHGEGACWLRICKRHKGKCAQKTSLRENHVSQAGFQAFHA